MDIYHYIFLGIIAYLMWRNLVLSQWMKEVIGILQNISDVFDKLALASEKIKTTKHDNGKPKSKVK